MQLFTFSLKYLFHLFILLCVHSFTSLLHSAGFIVVGELDPSRRQRDIMASLAVGGTDRVKIKKRKPVA